MERVRQAASDGDSAFLQRQMERAQRELPELEAKAGQPFPKADELVTKRARLKALVSVLDANNKQAPVASEQAAEDDTTPLSLSGASVALPVEERVSTATAADEVENRIGQFSHQPPVLIRDSAQGVIPGATASDGIAGAVYGGKIHLFLDQLGSRRDVQTTLFHELFHYGLRRFLTREQYVEQLTRLAQRDSSILAEARRWVQSPHGQRVLASGGDAYVLARGVDEALATLAEPNAGAFLRQGASQKLRRALQDWLAGVADFLGFKQTAAEIRGWNSTEARLFIQSVFAKLENDASPTSDEWGFTADAAFSLPKISKNSAAWKRYQAALGTLRELAADDVAYVRSNSGKTVRFERDGKVLAEVRTTPSNDPRTLNQWIVETVPSTKAQALEMLERREHGALGRAAIELEAAKARRVAAAEKNQAKKQALAELADDMRAHGDLIATAHHNRDLTFHLLPGGIQGESVLLHASPAYGKKPGSHYFLTRIEGRPAYVRVSDHWGQFDSREMDMSQFQPGRDTMDSSGWPSFWKSHNWRMDGAESGERQAGYVFLSELPGIADDAAQFWGSHQAKTGTPTDRAVMDMAREGQPAQGILRLIADTSKSRFNRQVARLLLKTGITPEVLFADADLGGGDGFKFKAKYSRAQDRVTLTGEAAGQAEQIVLHELIHAATLKALDKPGLHSLQMRRLYEHVKRQGGAAGQYGMKNVGEFVAEAFTNPEFQRLLRQMDAPAGGTLKSAWDGFVRILRSILGLPQDGHDALSRALEVGVAVMREDMGLRKTLAMTSMRKYPGTTDFETIKDRIVPSYAQSDTGDVRIVYPDERGGQEDAHFGAAELGRIKTSALDQINASLSHPGKVSLWDKSVGTMRNLAERAPAFKPVYEAAQRFIDDVATMANDAADMAPRVLPRVDSWRDLAKKPISAADNKAVAKPLFEGTLLWTRDANDKPVLVSEMEKRCEGKKDRSPRAARELKKNWPEGQQRTEKAVNSPHPLTPEKGVNPAADFPDARPADGSLAATICTPDYQRLVLLNHWRTRPNLAFICVNDTSTSASWRACKRSNVRQCMPLGLGPLPFRMPGSQPSRSRSLSACRVARLSKVSRSLR